MLIIVDEIGIRKEKANVKIYGILSKKLKKIKEIRYNRD